MKKLFAISFVLIVLLSGMHFSVATHICGGKIAAVKVSFAGEKATCGMESEEQSPTNNAEITSSCCQNNISILAVDNNYNPSQIQINEVTRNIIQVFNIPVCISYHSFIAVSSLRNNVIPPNIAIASAVSLADICIFRI